MKIINKGNCFTDKQLVKIVKTMKLDYIPAQLIICEDRKSILSMYLHVKPKLYVGIILDLTIWCGKVEGLYLKHIDTVIVYVFSQNDDGEDKQSKQLYSLHALCHEMRHRWQDKNDFYGDEEKDADKYATKFVDKNSKIISNIMNWSDEWEVEEED